MLPNFPAPSTGLPPLVSNNPRNFGLLLILGFHRMFGFRGWLFCIGLIMMVIASVKDQRGRDDRYQHEFSTTRPYAPEYESEARPPDPVFGEPDPVATPAGAETEAGQAPPVVPSTAIVPIAATSGVPFAQRAPMFMELEDTRRLARGVTGGAESGNQNVLNEGMRRLRRNIPARHGDAERLADVSRALAFMALLPSLSAEERRSLLEQSARDLQVHPNDAETTCQWAWLALLLDERQFAEDAFIRAIWADPDYRGGWAGLAFSSRDEVSAHGAMIMADRAGPLTQEQVVEYEKFRRFVREQTARATRP